MDDETKRALRALAVTLDELADRQDDTANASGDGEYSRGARDAYKDAARRIRGAIVIG